MIIWQNQLRRKIEKIKKNSRGKDEDTLRNKKNKP